MILIVYFPYTFCAMLFLHREESYTRKRYYASMDETPFVMTPSNLSGGAISALHE